MDGEMAGFEKDMARLEARVARLSGNDVDLDESIRLYADAAALIERCNSQLKTAQVQMEEIDGRLLKMRQTDEL
jgi:exodeoxyribonuclease VII small subunit